MNPRWAGLTAPFRWLIDAVDVGRHQPAVVIGAIVIASLVGFLPSLPPQLMAMAGSPPGVAAQLLFQAVALVVALAISPVLVAGVYRVIDGAEQGRPVAVAQITDGFRDGAWGPLTLLTALSYLLMAGVALVMALTMAAVAGVDALQALQQWAEQVMALNAQAQASGAPIQPDAVPPPPDGLGGVFAVLLAFLPLWLLLVLGMGWALVSVALRGTPPVAALVAGLRAAFVNALPLLAFAFLLALPALLLGLLLGMVMVAVVAVAAMLGPLVGGVIMMALMFGFTVVIAAIGYGFVLNGWRAACDGGDEGRSTSRGPEPPPMAGIEA